MAKKRAQQRAKPAAPIAAAVDAEPLPSAPSLRRSAGNSKRPARPTKAASRTAPARLERGDAAGAKPAKVAASTEIVPRTTELTAAQLATLSPGRNLETYLRTIHSFEILSKAEEKRLARRLRNAGDGAAAGKLVLSHLRFVAHIARGYLGYGLPYADLIQEGNVGLIKAVQHFDPEVGVRLVSFAVHWIKSDIHDYVLRNWSIVKIATTKAQRKLFFNLRGMKGASMRLTREEAEAIAAELNVKAEEVLEMEKRLGGTDLPLPQPGGEADGDNAPALPELAASVDSEPVEIVETEQLTEHNRSQLHRALGELDERGRDIVQRRWLSDRKVGLKELAAEYGVSAERIRQIEAAALHRISRSFGSAELSQ